MRACALLPQEIAAQRSRPKACSLASGRRGTHFSAVPTSEWLGKWKPRLSLVGWVLLVAWAGWTALALLYVAVESIYPPSHFYQSVLVTYRVAGIGPILFALGMVVLVAWTSSLTGRFVGRRRTQGGS